MIGPTNVKIRDKPEPTKVRSYPLKSLDISLCNESLGEPFAVDSVGLERFQDMLWVQEREAAAVKGEMN